MASVTSLEYIKTLLKGGKIGTEIQDIEIDIDEEHKVICQIKVIEVLSKESKITQKKRKPGEYPGFGSASKKVIVSEKDVEEAKKSLYRNIEL